MAGSTDVYTGLLKEYPRAIVHMRSQFKLERFTLLFGAGLNVPFGLPNWRVLITAIANDPEVDGTEILARFPDTGSEPYKTELLLQHFRNRRAAGTIPGEVGSPEFESRALAAWYAVCAKHLYAKMPQDFATALKGHAYLPKYLPLIRGSAITVTYNFDDFIERALFETKARNDSTLGYETVTNPWTQFRRPYGVIYHPHGVLPQELMEFPQDRLVFSQSAYARLFLGALAGDFTFLLNLLSKHTCLIVGHSLGDEDLRNVLVQSAQMNPGNPHYYVQYVEPAADPLSAADKSAIRRANVQVYNLITLFLNADQIGSLADLVHDQEIKDDEFEDLVQLANVRSSYCFYLTGAIGVGKSTTANQLRNLTVLDEWAEPRLSLLAKPWDTLEADEKVRCDEWILRQFRLKNNKLRHMKDGIAVVDRPPMDPLAFTPVAERPAKATALLQAVCPGQKWQCVDGVVIFLRGDSKELAARALATGRPEYSERKLQKMDDDLNSIYQGEGVMVVDTRGRSIAEVTKRVSEIIHCDRYGPCPLHTTLMKTSAGG
jgi:broad-specificity NMP kinase